MTELQKTYVFIGIGMLVQVCATHSSPTSVLLRNMEHDTISTPSDLPLR